MHVQSSDWLSGHKISAISIYIQVNSALRALRLATQILDSN